MAEDKDDAVEVSGASDTQLSAEIAARELEVARYLDRKDKAGALAVALTNPPVGAKAPEIKDRNAAVVEKVLSLISEKEIPQIVNSLDLESLDILMKYVFRFMSKATNSGLMLKIHESITEKAGLGSIVRVMTDRKQV